MQVRKITTALGIHPRNIDRLGLLDEKPQRRLTPRQRLLAVTLAATVALWLAGAEITRTDIVEHVWDMEYDGLTNIVDVYIRRLRSKIDEGHATALIHTVRGLGYRLEAPA